jgi:peptide deformylase
MPSPSRRHFLFQSAALGLLGPAACAPRRTGPTLAERRLLFAAPRPLPLVLWRRDLPDRESVLRRRARPAAGLPGPVLAALVERLRETLGASGGVGLAAPQVGIGRRVILVARQTPAAAREGTGALLACVDPVVLRRADGEVQGYEACLSVPGVGGRVPRAAWVVVRYLEPGGRWVTHRAEGFEARIFQHELDHLDGILYLDRLRGPLLPLEEMRRRRREEGASAAPPAPRHAALPSRRPPL